MKRDGEHSRDHVPVRYSRVETKVWRTHVASAKSDDCKLMSRG